MDKIRKESVHTEQSLEGDLMITGPRPTETLVSSDGPAGMEIVENQTTNKVAGLEFKK